MATRGLLILLFTVLCVSATTLKFDAYLSGDQEVPAVVTLGEGYGTLSLDVEERELKWDIDYSFMDPLTTAHIHGPAEMGVNGDVIIELKVSEGSTDGSISGKQSLTLDQVMYLKNGLTYINIHTEENPDGAIRGQVLSLSTYFQAELRGSEETNPPVLNTNEEGFVTVEYDYDTMTMSYDIDHNVEGANALHFHAPARPGENADIIRELDHTKGDILLSETEAEYLRSGLMYVNVHSDTHPNGAIRGQLLIEVPESGSNDWVLYGAAFAGVSLLLFAAGVIGVVIYKKKGDAIHNIFTTSAKRQEISDSLSVVSDDAFLD